MYVHLLMMQFLIPTDAPLALVIIPGETLNELHINALHFLTNQVKNQIYLNTI